MSNGGFEYLEKKYLPERKRYRSNHIGQSREEGIFKIKLCMGFLTRLLAYPANSTDLTGFYCALCMSLKRTVYNFRILSLLFLPLSLEQDISFSKRALEAFI